MSPRGRRIRYWVAVGLGQVGLVYLAGAAVAHRTVIPWSSFGIPGDSGQYTFHGWPLVWSEYQQQGDHIGVGSDLPGAPPTRTDSGPMEFKGRNWGVPVLMFMLAVYLPPVTADLFTRRRGLDGLRPRPSRPVRLARVGLFAAVMGLAATGLELETSTYVFRLRDAELYGRGCTSGGLYGPTYFLDRTIDSYRPKTIIATFNGQPVYAPPQPWIGGSEWYRKAHRHLDQFRQELTGEPRPSSAPLSEWPRPEDVWRFRTRLTLASTGLGVLLGCLLFRPWRRSAALPAAAPDTSPAPGTAPPAA